MLFLNKVSISLALGLLFYQGVIAKPAQPAPSPFPRGCETTGYGYNQLDLILNENGEQTLFLLQNRSPLPVELQHHETKDVFMSPPLTAKIGLENWAAFASDISNTRFSCFVHEGENLRRADCRAVLNICQYPRVKFAVSNMGNYWISVNKGQRQVILDTANNGILLRW